MDLVGKRIRMIISDPWERYKDTQAVAESSFEHEGRCWILIREETSDKTYLVSPRYLDTDLDMILNGQSAPVGIAETGKPSPTLPVAEIVNNSHYIGIGSIELAREQ